MAQHYCFTCPDYMKLTSRAEKWKPNQQFLKWPLSSQAPLTCWLSLSPTLSFKTTFNDQAQFTETIVADLKLKTFGNVQTIETLSLGRDKRRLLISSQTAAAQILAAMAS